MTALRDTLLATPDHKARAAIRAQAHLARLSGPLTLNRGGLTVRVDSYGPLTNAAGETIGVQAWVRAFRGAHQLAIDGHLTVVNPPTEHNGVEDLQGVFEEWIFDSLAVQGRRP